MTSLRLKTTHLTLAFLVLNPLSALAFYCGNSIVSQRDTTTQVLVKCGEPTARYTWTQSKSHAQNHINVVSDKTVVAHLAHHATQATYDEWIYNFGPHQFLYILKFRNGRLVDIETNGYGYYD